MTRSLETMVARMRKRKQRMIVCGVTALVCLGLLLAFLQIYRNMLAGLAPPEGSDAMFRLVLNQQLIVAIAMLQTMAFVLGGFLALAAAGFVGAATGFSRTDLLVRLWDRVQELERAQLAAASSQSPPALP
jgi:hypothetical protein